MTRWFNTAGPCKPDLHYMLPVMRRLPTVRQLIDRQSYFVLHAPRQVGKTTSLMALGRELTREGRYASVLVSMEVGAPFSHDVGAAELAILGEWRRAAQELPPELQPPPWPAEAPGGQIAAGLQSWVKACPRPLVVFLDEIDALQGEALVAVLRQIRAGYPRRPDAFPWSLALVGLRDVRDGELASGGAAVSPHSSSPFNIKVVAHSTVCAARNPRCATWPHLPGRDATALSAWTRQISSADPRPPSGPGGSVSRRPS